MTKFEKKNDNFWQKEYEKNKPAAQSTAKRVGAASGKAVLQGVLVHRVKGHRATFVWFLSVGLAMTKWAHIWLPFLFDGLVKPLVFLVNIFVKLFVIFLSNFLLFFVKLFVKLFCHFLFNFLSNFLSNVLSFCFRIFCQTFCQIVCQIVFHFCCAFV